MRSHGGAIEDPASFRRTLRGFMEENGVRGDAERSPPNPSSPPYQDLYSTPWMRAILARSDIDDVESEPLSVAHGRNNSPQREEPSAIHRSLLCGYLLNMHRGVREVRNMIIADLRRYIDLGAEARAADLLAVLKLFLSDYN